MQARQIALPSSQLHCKILILQIPTKLCRRNFVTVKARRFSAFSFSLKSRTLLCFSGKGRRGPGTRNCNKYILNYCAVISEKERKKICFWHCEFNSTKYWHYRGQCKSLCFSAGTYNYEEKHVPPISVPMETPLAVAWIRVSDVMEQCHFLAQLTNLYRRPL